LEQALVDGFTGLTTEKSFTGYEFSVLDAQA